MPENRTPACPPESPDSTAPADVPPSSTGVKAGAGEGSSALSTAHKQRATQMWQAPAFESTSAQEPLGTPNPDAHVDARGGPAGAPFKPLEIVASPWRFRPKPVNCRGLCGGPPRIRTWDQGMMSPLLYGGTADATIYEAEGCSDGK